MFAKSNLWIYVHFLLSKNKEESPHSFGLSLAEKKYFSSRTITHLLEF